MLHSNGCSYFSEMTKAQNEPTKMTNSEGLSQRVTRRIGYPFLRFCDERSTMEREVKKMPKAKRLEDLPPKIQELLKKRGWTFPPTEEMKREWREAAKQFDGSLHTDPEVLEMMWEEEKPDWLRRWKEQDPEGYRRWKEEATKRYLQWKRQQERKEKNDAP